jgi:lambda family phage portal protein
LNPGETLVSPQVPDAPGYGDFMYEEIHKIAASLGLTYEMITGNLKGVNYSSARVGLLEVRRGFEQFQQQIVIKQFCKPVMQRWMREAVLSGHLELPADYADNPEVYEQCTWIPDGWPWVDPVKEVQASQMAVRSGFTSKSMVIRQNGYDPDTIADQIAKEREQELKIGIVTDTNSNLVLIGRETQPTTVTPPHPTHETDEEADEDENTDE